jgi:hypothetical protein
MQTGEATQLNYTHVIESLSQYNIKNGGTNDIKVKAIYLFGSRLFSTHDESSDYVRYHLLE